MNYFKVGVIPETDSHEEMREIGKEIVFLKPEIYTEKCVENLMKDIYSFFGTEKDKSEATDLFYETVYNYWTFGCNISEWARYEFYSKTYSEREKYYTSKNKALYLSHLNDVKYRHILDDKFETYKALTPYFRRKIINVSTENDFEEFVNFIGDRQVIVKPENGGLGAGVHKISGGGGNR